MSYNVGIQFRETPWGKFLRMPELLIPESFFARQFQRRFRLPYPLFLQLIFDLKEFNIFDLSNPYSTRLKIPIELKCMSQNLSETSKNTIRLMFWMFLINKTVSNTVDGFIQRLISQQLQLQRQQRELASIPNLPPAHAAAVHNPLSPDDSAIRQQGLINCLWINRVSSTPESSHWLQANPAFWINRLTDNAFMIAFWVRSKFRVMGPRRYCICDEPVDCLGDHVLSCPRVTVRNQVRNTAHASLSSQLRRCISSHSASSEYVVAAGEPPLARYLESNLPVIHPAATAADDPWRSYSPRDAELTLH
jgi:hypothetical protein